MKREKEEEQTALRWLRENKKREEKATDVTKESVRK